MLLHSHGQAAEVRFCVRSLSADAELVLSCLPDPPPASKQGLKLCIDNISTGMSSHQLQRALRAHDVRVVVRPSLMASGTPEHSGNKAEHVVAELRMSCQPV